VRASQRVTRHLKISRAGPVATAAPHQQGARGDEAPEDLEGCDPSPIAKPDDVAGGDEAPEDLEYRFEHGTRRESRTQPAQARAETSCSRFPRPRGTLEGRKAGVHPENGPQRSHKAKEATDGRTS